MYIDMCEHVVFYLDIFTTGNGVKGGVSFSLSLSLSVCVIHTSARCIIANENSKPPKLRCMMTGTETKAPAIYCPFKSSLTVALYSLSIPGDTRYLNHISYL